MGQHFLRLRGPTIGKFGPAAGGTNILAPSRDSNEAVSRPQGKNKLRGARSQGYDPLEHARTILMYAGPEMHSARLLDHFEHPRNPGEVPGAGVVVEVSNPVCGDILKLWLLIDGERIARAGFKCRGCVASMAAGSALTELITSLTIREARQIAANHVEEAVGGLETASKHAAVLAVDALKQALMKAAG